MTDAETATRGPIARLVDDAMMARDISDGMSEIDKVRREAREQDARSAAQAATIAALVAGLTEILRHSYEEPYQEMHVTNVARAALEQARAQ